MAVWFSEHKKLGVDVLFKVSFLLNSVNRMSLIGCLQVKDTDIYDTGDNMSKYSEISLFS